MTTPPHKVWVMIDGEKILVEVEDLNQRPVIAIVEGSRLEVFPEELEQESPEHDVLEVSLEEQPMIHTVPGGTECEVTSPMPGDIVKILVKPGQVVDTGQALCILDAMKMKNTIHSPQPGTISEVCVQVGDSVEYGTYLFRLN
jgi:pyruvate carboxylase subunit B